MRTTSFIIAFALLLLGPSMAGTAASGSLPGVGTFEFNGSTPQTDAPMLLALVR